MIRVRCRPRPAYGAITPRAFSASGAIHYSGGVDDFYLTSDLPHTSVLDESAFELRETGRMVFSYGAPYPGSLRFGLEEDLERTASHWRRWARHCNIPFEFQSEVLRSALTLKLHIFEDTGAIIAATTTSIPEGPHSGRTWDYRYCWLRDAYFVITALGRLGQFEEIEHFIRYLQNICAAEGKRALQPVYGIGGEREFPEKVLPWLSGYQGHGPVRVGNAAYAMEQHDVYGEMVLALTRAFFDERMHQTDLSQAFASVQQLVEQASATYELPDAGIWEFRGKKEHSTFSKLMCWAALDCGVQIAEKLGHQEFARNWSKRRSVVWGEIYEKSWNGMVGYFTQSFGGDSPDAANLLMATLNFLGPDNERLRSSVDSYDRLLRVAGGVYRYRAPDDFGVPTSTFTVCAFWLADALWAIGRKEEARELFSSVLSRANHLGLLSEDFDPDSGVLWGNFPQTYSHVGLINTAWRISRSWEDAFK
ncbi:glycoside hydrolase family 15 protein [bacterium]|nr:glycoside hydrolase family 15 protein [bacterium]